MLDNYKVCCICGKTFEGYGNDPWPVKEKGECCDECNYEKVIPARIEQLKSKEQKKAENDYLSCVEMECLWNDGEGRCVCPTQDKDNLIPDKNECSFYSQD